MSQAAVAPALELPAETHPECVACAPDHPHGLHLSFAVSEDGTAAGKWIPGEDWQGFRGLVHGGIISTVLDEAMSRSARAILGDSLTAELRIRYRHPVSPGEVLRIRSWVVEHHRCLLRAEASLEDANGTERAHGWSVFMTPR